MTHKQSVVQCVKGNSVSREAVCNEKQCVKGNSVSAVCFRKQGAMIEWGAKPAKVSSFCFVDGQ